MKTFQEKENACRLLFEEIRASHGPIWHLYTPGNLQEIVFADVMDFRYGMNVLASAALDTPGVFIITFEIMSNHLHVVLAGSEAAVRAFFSLLKKRLRRHLALSGRTVSLACFEAGLKLVEDLESLRNVIAYCNRNNYVIDPNHTPFSYLYGANWLFFNPLVLGRPDCLYGDLTIQQKRSMFHSHTIDYPDTLPVRDGFVSPEGYCLYKIGEGLFRDARHYFHKISRDIEAYASVAAGIGETLFYTDDELYAAACRISSREYGMSRPSLIGRSEKMALARNLHFNYNASNKQLQRILRLDPHILNELFPEPMRMS